MLMYYDARVEKIYNGLFDSDTLEPLKNYYAFKMFSELYQYGTEIKCDCDAEGIYAISAKNADNKTATLISYFTDIDGMPDKTLLFESERGINNATLYLLDISNDCTPVKTVNSGESITICPNTVLLISENS